MSAEGQLQCSRPEKDPDVRTQTVSHGAKIIQLACLAAAPPAARALGNLGHRLGNFLASQPNVPRVLLPARCAYREVSVDVLPFRHADVPWTREMLFGYGDSVGRGVGEAHGRSYRDERYGKMRSMATGLGIINV